MSIKKMLFTGILAAIVAASGATSVRAEDNLIRGSDEPGVVKNNYIVVLKDDVATASAGNLLQEAGGGEVKQTYHAALSGFAAQMSEQAANTLAKNPSVKFVEQDAVATAGAMQANPPAWGLDRIDQRNLPLSRSFTYPNTANNVTAYILDSGIRTSHQEFGGRAVDGFDFIDNDPIANDCRGHGTHVAGIVGGTKYGVAKNVKLVAIKVLGCDGTGLYSQIIAGIDWMVRHANGPSVANMSLGGNASSALNNAVQRAIDSGIVFAVSAGNDGGDACGKSPASTPAAITVGNTTSSDTRYLSSNHGACLDVFAPGTSILSAYHTTNNARTRMTGTSMSTPHVTGVAAVVRAAHPSWTPQQVRDYIVTHATSNVVANPGVGSPNRLLHLVNSTTPPPQQPMPNPLPRACGPLTNATNYRIPDSGQAKSVVSAGRCNGVASDKSVVTVRARHTYRGDLSIYLQAPDGTRYTLKQSNPYDSSNDVQENYTVNLSQERINGEWKLYINDQAEYDEGYIDAWALKP